MKQYVTFIITAIILLVSVAISANFDLMGDKLVASNANATVVEEVYTLKSSNGHLVVYRGNEEKPIITTDTLVNTLPKQDQSKLLTGISVIGDKNLRVALEDYCS